VRTLIAAASAFAALVLAGASQAAFPASQGRLLLVSEDQGFAAPALLRNGQPLVTGVPVGIHGTAAMSPDGTQLAIVNTVPLFPGIQVPDLIVGSLIGEFDVLPISGLAGRVSWSPDGSKIAFAGNASGNWDIYVVDAGGGSPVDLTSSSSAAHTEPRWSPDGTKIAFDSDRSENVDVYSMSTDALKSSGRRGSRGRFRFTIREDSGTVSVSVEYSYRIKNGSASGFGSQTLHGLRAGHVYGISFPTRALSGAPSFFRFCVTATDPSANDSARSCARFHLLPKKKLKKKR
jgi:WD40 repeat protein